MKTDELREKYLAFFETKGHMRRPSDVLVPTWDPSVLFTPAGMNQFKDHFLGRVKLEFTQATTCQKCLRTGDIDNVGRTAYHHTFFEMLGNFSFGDYFKREAIHWAWEFLTKKEWLAIDPTRLSVTVYKDDQEAAEIWSQEIKLAPEKIEWMDEDENFWPASAPSQGPDGVCGPCSEIFYHPDDGNAVEIWNLVFTQFNRVGDPPDNLRPLPSRNIDTGMGLERTAAVLQGAPTNYHIDSLYPLVQAAAEVCGVKYDLASENGRRLRRITDHIRACTFAIHENVYPGPKDAKYVVRRLLRRAVLDGHQMGIHDPFLHQLIPAVVDGMKGPYPELTDTQDRVGRVVREEEERFFGTIDSGLERIERVFETMKSENRVAVDGQVAADLYQTNGVPAELFETLATERNFTFDWEGFRRAMEQHGIESGAGQRELFKTGPIESLKRALHTTEFLGYETTEAEATIKGIVAGVAPDDHLCDRMDEVGHALPVRVVLDRSPFYGESGGQVGDYGILSGEGFEFEVIDTKKDSELIIHYGHLRTGVMTEGAKLHAQVDGTRRDAIRRAHSATHVLHYALQKNLGKHAQQQGSKVDDDWLRFDFTNLAPVSADQLSAIERDVNDRVEAKEPIHSTVVPLAEARSQGAMMLFGEKYPDPVRMVSMGEFSKELCGGTHLENTGQIDRFELLNEEGVSAGTRRIVALTGGKAREHAGRTRETLDAVADRFGVARPDVLAAVEAVSRGIRDRKKALSSGGKLVESTSDLQVVAGKSAKETLSELAKLLAVAPLDVAERARRLQADLADLDRQLATRADAGEISVETLIDQAEVIGGAKLVIASVPAANPNLMRQWIDQIRRKASPVAVFLVTAAADDKVVLVAGLSRELVEQGAHAGNWVREIAKIVGGGGGGKPDMAQAGGKDPSKIPDALEQAKSTLASMLGE